MKNLLMIFFNCFLSEALRYQLLNGRYTILIGLSTRLRKATFNLLEGCVWPCYLGRKCQYQPMWLNTDLQATNITVEWILLLGSHDLEYLIYKAFRQKSKVFDSGSGSSIKYSVFSFVCQWRDCFWVITRENYFKSIIMYYSKDSTVTLTLCEDTGIL